MATNLHAFFGDIHNHCGISYGEGSLEDAYANARLQLDFASVTGHAWWHDMPDTDEIRRVNPRLAAHVDEHDAGMRNLVQSWDRVLAETNALNEEGKFVTFPSFEWHSTAHGDRCVYYRDGTGPILKSESIQDLHNEIAVLRGQGVAAMVLPHHTAYGVGNRGLVWDEFDSEFAPVVEILSFHGCADSDVTRSYLTPLGPRDWSGTLQLGLRAGHKFGIIGSTDHHNGHPGTYGMGRMGVWANDLTRHSLWDAIHARRTFALTGAVATLDISLNGEPMGSTSPYSASRQIQVRVDDAGNAVDSVDLFRDGQLIDRKSPLPVRTSGIDCFSVPIKVGWGHAGPRLEWAVSVTVEGGKLHSIEPRFRGRLVLVPEAEGADPDTRFSSISRSSDDGIAFQTVTHGNANVVTDEAQAVALRIEGDDRTLIRIEANGTASEFRIGDVLGVEKALWPFGYMAGAIQVGPVYGSGHRSGSFDLNDTEDDGRAHSYHARIRMLDEQYGWTSPVWVDSRDTEI